MTLSKGEKVKGLTGVVITNRPGQAKLLRPMTIGGHKAPAGAVVYLLTYQGEGFYKAWYDGKVFKNLDFSDESLIKVETAPDEIWWVKVRDRKGQTGWTKETDHFGNMDACG
ncbi:hypothetical protein [uncultured Thiodictyon sp.]|uniref:hypothetical protein n=1 Tax=uncultured Thiodictyon sp. TaxID=1846217 RepID=UPI0025F621B8|nr:hypothetical protein [uncultured Thiodictyon sp.]